MRCHQCGSRMKPRVTDLPFKIADISIVVIRQIPVLQCEGCGEYELEDDVMGRVEILLAHADSAVELEIIRYAA